MKRLVVIILCMLASMNAVAQKDFGGAVRFDRTVYDFGKVNIKDGAVSCSFKVTNIGNEKLNILAATTTCSCTKVQWTKEDIAPGDGGVVEVSYSNDEGPYPFDKPVMVYLSCLERPVVLHIKGISYKGKK